MNHIPRFRKGQALVELALVASILVLLLVVAIEGGIALAMGHSFTVAAREAARHISCARSVSAERTAAFAETLVRDSLARQWGASSPIPAGALVTVTEAPLSGTTGTTVRVEVTYPLPATWFINRTGTMKIKGGAIFEQQVVPSVYTSS